MALYKRVNGVRIQMSEEEEQVVRDQWAANDIAKEQREIDEADERARKEGLVTAIKAKTGLSDEELDLLKNI